MEVTGLILFLLYAGVSAFFKMRKNAASAKPAPVRTRQNFDRVRSRQRNAQGGSSAGSRDSSSGGQNDPSTQAETARETPPGRGQRPPQVSDRVAREMQASLERRRQRAAATGRRPPAMGRQGGSGMATIEQRQGRTLPELTRGQPLGQPLDQVVGQPLELIAGQPLGQIVGQLMEQGGAQESSPGFAPAQAESLVRSKGSQVTSRSLQRVATAPAKGLRQSATSASGRRLSGISIGVASTGTSTGTSASRGMSPASARGAAGGRGRARGASLAQGMLWSQILAQPKCRQFAYGKGEWRKNKRNSLIKEG